MSNSSDRLPSFKLLNKSDKLIEGEYGRVGLNLMIFAVSFHQKITVARGIRIRSERTNV